jgi:hypothetical protein
MQAAWRVTQLLQMAVARKRRVCRAIIDQQSRDIVEKQWCCVRRCSRKDARSKFLDVWIYPCSQFTKCHEEAAGVLKGRNDQFAVVRVPQPAGVLGELFNDLKWRVVSTSSSPVIDQLCFPKDNLPAFAEAFDRDQIHTRCPPFIRSERVGRESHF